MPELLPADLPAPHIDPGAAEEIADDLVVVLDRDVPLVPNVGVIGGRDAVLVVDTGIGPDAAAELVGWVADRAGDRRLFVTTTHFHPEHAFGAPAFTAAGATWLVNRDQATDLRERAPGYLEMFRGFGPVVAGELAGVELVAPDEVYDGTRTLELGGRTVELRPTGRGHTPGDQVVVVPDAGVLFGGDLVETARFPLLPWFPPHDTVATGVGWIAVLERLIAGDPAVVVPGHGALGGVERLHEQLAVLRLLRDETWRRCAAGLPREQIVAGVTDALIAARPDWAGREWLEAGADCFAAEHTAHDRTEVTA